MLHAAWCFAGKTVEEASSRGLLFRRLDTLLDAQLNAIPPLPRQLNATAKLQAQGKGEKRGKKEGGKEVEGGRKLLASAASGQRQGRQHKHTDTRQARQPASSPPTLGYSLASPASAALLEVKGAGEECSVSEVSEVLAGAAPH